LLFQLSACKSRGKKQTDSSNEIRATTVDNSQVSVDWAGTYAGLLPCADCPGIETRLTLNIDNTYQISWKYQDRKNATHQNSGSFLWNTGGGIITLGNLDKDQYPTQYLVGEDRLFQLDLQGNRITGDLEQNYILTKVQQ
jgi:uncharacterized lipoprotein NlpE involved in copper resistance